jgi:hypothetical protein
MLLGGMLLGGVLLGGLLVVILSNLRLRLGFTSTSKIVDGRDA